MKLLLIAWAAFALIMGIVRPHPSVTLALGVACLIAGSVLYFAGPTGPWWHGGSGT